jgi:hypothetical protein
MILHINRTDKSQGIKYKIIKVIYESFNANTSSSTEAYSSI